MSGSLTPAPTPPHALSTTPLRIIPAQALATSISPLFPWTQHSSRELDWGLGHHVVTQPGQDDHRLVSQLLKEHLIILTALILFT